MSSDLGPLLLRGVDRQIGLTERLNAAVVDTGIQATSPQACYLPLMIFDGVRHEVAY